MYDLLGRGGTPESGKSQAASAFFVKGGVPATGVGPEG